MVKLLLTVEDVFDLEHGTVIEPAPALPEGAFEPFVSTVTVEPPGEDSFQAEASFQFWHFNPGGYRMVVSLPQVAKQRVPIGSRVLAGESVHARLSPNDG